MILHFIWGYQEENFSQEEKKQFVETDYTVTLESNRMGYRLQGKAIQSRQKEIISEDLDNVVNFKK